jgi:hypothetical protein
VELWLSLLLACSTGPSFTASRADCRTGLAEGSGDRLPALEVSDPSGSLHLRSSIPLRAASMEITLSATLRDDVGGLVSSTAPAPALVAGWTPAGCTGTVAVSLPVPDPRRLCVLDGSAAVLGLEVVSASGEPDRVESPAMIRVPKGFRARHCRRER